MSQLKAILDKRMKSGSATSKMAEMARQSSQGQLSSFSGVFGFAELTPLEKERLKGVLQNHALAEEPLSTDLEALISITSEIKAINNQAIILHGERIKRAQTLLLRYKEGAFTAWLLAAYGNRQTPYNLLQYYEFYESMPKGLRPKLEEMPRQAIYTLASRSGQAEKKHQLVENYRGETKAELLEKIRVLFPLDEKDRRHKNQNQIFLEKLRKISKGMQDCKLSSQQQRQLSEIIIDLQLLLKGNK
jgi:hypothetical protein